MSSLPVELLDRILSFIDSPKCLASLSQTCKLFQKLTDSHLYNSVLIVNGKATSFAEGILARPERKKFVKELYYDDEIKKRTDAPDTSACTCAPLYAEFANLEVLSLCSGYWHWDDDETHYRRDAPVKWETDQDKLTDLFDQAGLSKPVEERIWQKLRSCTLDLWERNGQGWYCSFEPAIFLVASLEELTLRGCRFTDEDGEQLLTSPYRGQTALRKLALERSYVHHTAVYNFLSAPKALTHLTLAHRENLWHHEMGVQPSNSRRADDYMPAFKQQQDSLQFLHLNEEWCDEVSEGTFDFRNFSALLKVEYDESGFLLNDNVEVVCVRLRADDEV
jgi:hypothetical protein